MPYVDGTVKYARGKFSISGKGGNSDGGSFIESYSSIKGGGFALALDKGKAGDSKNGRGSKFKKFDKTKSRLISK